MPTLRKRNEPTRSLWGGVWEIWKMNAAPPSAHGGAPTVAQRFARGVEDLSYLERVLDIMLAHRSVCAKYLVLETLLNVAIPNATLWLSGYILSVLATEPQLHARDVVLALAVYTILPLIDYLVRDLRFTYESFLREKIQRYFILHMINVRARLDAVTAEDPLVAAQLAAADPESEWSEEQIQSWDLLWSLARAFLLVVSLLCSASLSTTTLHRHPSIVPLAIAASIKPIVKATLPWTGFDLLNSAWVAVAKDNLYLRFRGLRAGLYKPALRKEIVTSNLGSYIAKECARLASELKNSFLSRFSVRALLQVNHLTLDSATIAVLDQLPTAVLIFLVLTSRENVALLLASLSVVQQAVKSIDEDAFSLMYRRADVIKGLAELKQKYELMNLRNKVADGVLPFPDNDDGVSIEFENVSFAYPGSDVRAEKEGSAGALKGVSFKIHRGQFAVVVGANASGKSTIIKLLARLHDPDEGRIFVNGVDIRAIRLDELRARLAVLFQDFAFFALTIRENIALGDPDDAGAAAVDAAAKLAGIDFGDKFDKYLEHPAEAHQSAAQLHGALRDAALASASQTTDLSGGQKQKLAVARALVRAHAARTGALVLDEPTAALDAVAESSLFRTLRNIRAGKTVVVCSHRFGDLTRQADVIVHVERGRVVEQGTHDELLARGGGYATMWGKQAEAFVTTS